MAGSATLMTLPSRNDTKDARIAIHSTSLCVRADGREPILQATPAPAVAGLTYGRTYSPSPEYIFMSGLCPAVALSLGHRLHSTGGAPHRRYMMGIISSGFHGKRRTGNTALPPGQYETPSFPVLTAGPAPYIARADWEFFITTETGQRRAWSWDELLALPQIDIRTDIHCVTSWSKLGT